MKSHLFVIFVCLGAVIAVEEKEQTGATAENDSSNSEIRRILEDNNITLESLDRKAFNISNIQKGIESNLKTIGQDLLGIQSIEEGLKSLEELTERNFNLTIEGISILTNEITAAENRTNQAINGLGNTQQQIKQVLIQVDANQNKYERDLNAVAKSVNDNIAGLDVLIKQSVLQELVTLGQTGKKLENSQKHIERKIALLDDLLALSSITANKVHLLEQGVRSLNISQQIQLSAIGQTVHQVGTTTWQIDNKLGVLLSTQKNIERALEECKKYQRHHSRDHYDVQLQPQNAYANPSYSPVYSHKDTSMSSARSSYDDSYSNADEASYLYQLWYGKDHK